MHQYVQSPENQITNPFRTTQSKAKPSRISIRWAMARVELAGTSVYSLEAEMYWFFSPPVA